MAHKTIDKWSKTNKEGFTQLWFCKNYWNHNVMISLSFHGLQSSNYQSFILFPTISFPKIWSTKENQAIVGEINEVNSNGTTVIEVG